MRNILLKVVLSVVFMSIVCRAQTSLQQELLLVQNDATLNGAFKVGVSVRGTNLPSGTTVASFTIDLLYNHAALSFVKSSSWGLGSGDGYSRFANDVSNILRVGGVGMSVNQDGGGSPAGFDITTTPKQIVLLEFKILDPKASISFSIDPVSNQIAFFTNHANEPIGTAAPIDQPLSTPIVFGGVALPVELNAFGADVKNNTVLLAWKTATEVNNFGFDVERLESSAAGKSAAWTKLGFVAGSGTTNSSHAYSYCDRIANAAGTVKYRLKQIDNSGEFSYSREIEVTAASPSAYALGQNYPNPFNPSTVINFEIPVAGAVALSVYNILGEKVADAANAYYTAGHHTVAFNAAGLSSGMYFYRLAVNGMSITKKMHVLK